MRARMIGHARIACAAVLAATIAGCGGSPDQPAASPPNPPAPVFNQADVDFVAHMSQHHGQALQMTELARTRATSPAVKRLASRITKLRSAEIDRFGAWLATWGAAGAEMPPHGIGGAHKGPGMLDEAEVSQLAPLSGSRFERRFLDLMVRHHRGGRQLTMMQVAEGRNPQAVELAREIRDSAASDVAEMLEIRKARA